MLWRIVSRALKQADRNYRRTKKEIERQRIQEQKDAEKLQKEPYRPSNASLRRRTASQEHPVQSQQSNADLKLPSWMEQLVSMGLATKVYHDSTKWTWNIKATPAGKCQHCLGTVWNINETYFIIEHAPHCKPEGDGLHRWSEIGR